LDSNVEHAPERIDPAAGSFGTYERLGVADGDVVVYMWRPDERFRTDDRLEDCAR
jgi:hypothetical protein